MFFTLLPFGYVFTREILPQVLPLDLLLLYSCNVFISALFCFSPLCPGMVFLLNGRKRKKKKLHHPCTPLVTAFSLLENSLFSLANPLLVAFPGLGLCVFSKLLRSEACFLEGYTGTAMRSGPATSSHPLLLQPEFTTLSNLAFCWDHAVVAA